MAGKPGKCLREAGISSLFTILFLHCGLQILQEWLGKFGEWMTLFAMLYHEGTHDQSS